MILFLSSTDITFSYNQTEPVLNFNLGLSGMPSQLFLRLVDAQLLKETADNFTIRFTNFNNADSGPTELFMDFTLHTVPNPPPGLSENIFNVDQSIPPFCFNIPVKVQDTQIVYFVAEVFLKQP